MEFWILLLLPCILKFGSTLELQVLWVDVNYGGSFLSQNIFSPMYTLYSNACGD
jgi:hypothetical protein